MINGKEINNKLNRNIKTPKIPFHYCNLNYFSAVNYLIEDCGKPAPPKVNPHEVEIRNSPG